MTGKASIHRGLKLHDVVLVRMTEAKKGKKAQAELRVRPTVQGAVVVLENKTGRILAMAGGFSYPSSQLNRATQSARQPGSAFKPLTYLAALQKGLQPNTLVRDEPITLPPINGSAREQDYWTPKNYDSGSSGIVTLRQALENSKISRPSICWRAELKKTGADSRPHLFDCPRSADLQGMRAILSIGPRCTAGSADRSRGVLCRDCQRRCVAGPACDRVDRA